jgi:hypothetical protein
VLFSQMGVDSPIWWMYGPLLLLGGGMAITMTPLTTLIMSSVSLGKAGVGSAMNDTTRELGGALGVAVLGSLVTSTYTASIGDAVAGLGERERVVAESGLVGAFDVARGMGAAGSELVAAANQAFMDGVQVAALTGAAVVVVAAVAAWRLLPRTLPAAVELAERIEPAEGGEELDEELEELASVPT